MRGATVVFSRTGSTDSVVLYDSDSMPGYYVDTVLSTRPWVFPCSSYQMRVNYQTFSGQARIQVPGLFYMTRPYNLDTLTDTTMAYFAWRQSAGAAAYALYVLKPNWQKLHFHIPVITFDTAVNMRPLYQGLFDSTGLYTVKVFALDSALANQQGSGLDTIGTDVLGQVGAQTIDQIRVYYRRLRP